MNQQELLLQTTSAQKGIHADLAKWAEDVFKAKQEKTWTPLVDMGQQHAGYEQLDSKIVKLMETLKKDGFLVESGHLTSELVPLSPEAHEDMRALRVSGLREQFDDMVSQAYKDDESCRKVVTGNAGEDSPESIDSSTKKKKVGGDVFRFNADPTYNSFMAYSFLNLACSQWKKPYPLTPAGIPSWQKVHPFLRPVISNDPDYIQDALNLPKFRELPDHAKPDLFQTGFDKAGMQNLVYGSALVYSLVIRETHADPRLTNKDWTKIENLDSGLCHQSGTSLGNDGGMFGNATSDTHTNSLFPYSMDLLKNYVQHARMLAKDKSPGGRNLFKTFCGTTYFSKKYSDRGEGSKIQELLLQKLEQRTQRKNPITRKMENVTCDQAIEWGVKGYVEANISSCFRALQLYCPSYGMAHANLVVRAMRWNNGPLHSESTGVRPACRYMFSQILDAVEKDKGLCDLTEKI